MDEATEVRLAVWCTSRIFWGRMEPPKMCGGALGRENRVQTILPPDNTVADVLSIEQCCRSMIFRFGGISLAAGADLLGGCSDDVSRQGGNNGAGYGHEERTGVAAEPACASGSGFGYWHFTSLPVQRDIVAAPVHRERALAVAGEVAFDGIFLSYPVIGDNAYTNLVGPRRDGECFREARMHR